MFYLNYHDALGYYLETIALIIINKHTILAVNSDSDWTTKCAIKYFAQFNFTDINDFINDINVK